jgi:two-component system chemotaxis response regulator CheB
MTTVANSEEKIKVLVADDSGLMRLIVSDILNREDDIEVLDTAIDGKEATEKALELDPDVVVMDMHMGKYDGRYAVKNILKSKHIPIIILSAVGNSDLDPIMEALHLGAFDYLNKPKDGNSKVRQVSVQLVDKVRVASNQKSRGVQRTVKKVNPNQASHTFGN